MLKPNYLLRIGFPSIFTCLVMIFSGCNGLPGDGGTSTITGKVFVERYNESGTLYQQYYGAEERVYIIYGDGTSFDDETKTSYDGTFQFTFLRQGTYTIFSYSDCITCDGSTEVVLQTVEITDNHQDVTATDIVIEKR